MFIKKREKKMNLRSYNKHKTALLSLMEAVFTNAVRHIQDDTCRFAFYFIRIISLLF